MSSIVELTDVSVVYGDSAALSDISLDIAPGESVAILGPNGAGKTTMLEIISGFRRPSSGRVVVMGGDPLEFTAEVVSKLGIVLQNWRDHSMWRVEDLIKLVEYSHGQVGRSHHDYTQELIDVLGIKNLLGKTMLRLSGGERRKVDTCLALLSKPQLLILDEPTTAFDANGRRKFHELMRDLHDADTTLLWATHDLQEAEHNCDRIILLNKGVIVRDASPSVLRTEVSEGVCIEWRDSQGVLRSERTAHPDEKLRELVLAGAKDISMSASSFEDVYLDLLEGMEYSNVNART